MSFFFAFLLWWVKEIHHEESFITNLLLKLLASPWHVGKMNYCPILGQPKDKDTALLFLIVDWQDSTIRQHREWRKQEERLTAGSQRGWWGWREGPQVLLWLQAMFCPSNCQQPHGQCFVAGIVASCKSRASFLSVGKEQCEVAPKAL